VPCRSTYTGFALPVIGGAQPQAMPSFFLNATMPDIALRQWLLLRRGLLPAGNRRLARRQFWPIDTGNYRFSRAAAFAGTALAAVEMGDDAVAGLCLAALEEDCPRVVAAGTAHRPNASVWAHAVELLARSGKRNSFRDLIERPRNGANRPCIRDVSYPEVLVARAVHAEGALLATLYFGERPGRYRLGLSGLIPGGSYACDGTEDSSFVAGPRGQAAITVGLAGRSEIRIRPRA
jgi:hypothetical protein